MTQLTIDDMNVIIQMMDIAVKSGGLQIAQQALPLVHKLQQIAKEQNELQGTSTP